MKNEITAGNSIVVSHFKCQGPLLKEFAMKNRLKFFLLVAGVLLAPLSATADDVTGAESMICSSMQATVCSLDGESEIGDPWLWGIPQFVEIDLKKKEVRTTEASGERRATPFKYVERKDGLLVLQGVENGRAFSFDITEADCSLSVAVARDSVTVSVFGACTPLGKE